MGYFGGMYGNSYSANAPSSSSMYYTPNAYGGYSMSAAGSDAGRYAASQLQQLRGMMAGAARGGNPGLGAVSALTPYLTMAVTPGITPDESMQRMASTFNQFGMNANQMFSQANAYLQNADKKSTDRIYASGGGVSSYQRPNRDNAGGGSSGGGGGGGGGGSQGPNPLDYLRGIFGQYGGGGGGSFGSGWGR